MPSRAVPLVVAVGILIVSTGCTGSISEVPVASSGSPSPQSGSTVPAGENGQFGAVTLSCTDSGSGTRGDAHRDLQLGSVLLEGAEGSRTSTPRAVSVGLRVPKWAEEWRFLKSPVYVSRGLAVTTISLTETDGRALAWVPASDWTSGSPPNLTDWLASSVTFEGCPDRDVVYFGGFLADTNQSCVAIDARIAGRPAGSARVSLGGSACT